MNFDDHIYTCEKFHEIMNDNKTMWISRDYLKRYFSFVDCKYFCKRNRVSQELYTSARNLSEERARLIPH